MSCFKTKFGNVVASKTCLNFEMLDVSNSNENFEFWVTGKSFVCLTQTECLHSKTKFGR